MRVRKCYENLRKKEKENEVLLKTMYKLNRKVEHWKQKSAALKESSSESSDPIVLHVDELLADSEENFDIIQEKLIVGESVCRQVKKNYQSATSNQEKNIIARALTGSITSDRRIKTKLREMAPILKNRDQIDRETFDVERVQEDVEKFIIENSMVDPSKKNCRIVDGTLVSRHYLNATLIDLYKQYCVENQSNIALSTFCKYKPIYCVAPKFNERDTCACPEHIYMLFLIKTLATAEVITQKTTHQFVRSLTCEEMSRKCFDRTCNDCKDKSIVYNVVPSNRAKRVSYKLWVNVSEERVSGKTGKVIKVSYVKTENYEDEISNVVSFIKINQTEFLLHEMRIFHHYHEGKKLMEKLEDGNEEIIKFHMDFSQNWKTKYTKEIQAVHFGASRQQISLHTCHIYSSEVIQGFVSASDDLSHDASAATAHIIKALKHYQHHMSTIKHLHLISDSVSSTYRNKNMFFLTTQVLSKIFRKLETITHHYSESNHGKSSADGDGAVVKRTGDNLVKFGTDLPNFETFLKAISERSKNSVLVLPVSAKEILEMKNVLEERELKVKTFVGTTKVH